MPVATWRHPKNNAVILRSASFQNATTKKISSSNIVNAAQALGSSGVSHTIVQTYLNSILHISRSVVDDNKHQNNTLQSIVSALPDTVEFDTGDVPEGQGGVHNAQTSAVDFKSNLPKLISGATPESSSPAKVKKVNSSVSDSEIQLNDIVIEGRDGPGSPRAIDWEAIGNTQTGTSPVPVIPEEVCE